MKCHACSSEQNVRQYVRFIAHRYEKGGCFESDGDYRPHLMNICDGCINRSRVIDTFRAIIYSFIIFGLGYILGFTIEKSNRTGLMIITGFIAFIYFVAYIKGCKKNEAVTRFFMKSQHNVLNLGDRYILEDDPHR